MLSPNTYMRLTTTINSAYYDKAPDTYNIIFTELLLQYTYIKKKLRVSE